jgi:hypothetical protein
MGDAPDSFSVGLRSWFLPEDRRLGEFHDFAEAPGMGNVERPVLARRRACSAASFGGALLRVTAGAIASPARAGMPQLARALGGQ